MDNVFDTLYQMFIVVIFCLALSMLFMLYQSYNQTFAEIKTDLYQQHTVREY